MQSAVYNQKSAQQLHYAQNPLKARGGTHRVVDPNKRGEAVDKQVELQGVASTPPFLERICALAAV